MAAIYGAQGKFPGIPGRYLALAVMLHALLLGLRPTEKTQPWMPPLHHLRVQLANPLEERASTVQGMTENLKREKSAPTPAFRAPMEQGESPPASAATPGNSQPEAIDLSSQARALIQEESRRRGQDPMYQAPITAKRASPFGSLALGGARVENHFADELVRIRNPDGSTYCLRRPPHTDGPVEILALPSNCP